MAKDGDYLLDTNIIIALFNRERKVLQRVRRAERVFISVTVVGELYFGALQSGRVRENTDRIDQFVDASSLLLCDLETARHYGSVKDRLRRKGRPLPENDIWIAATARQHDLTLVSRDEHFREIDGLSVVVW